MKFGIVFERDVAVQNIFLEMNIKPDELCLLMFICFESFIQKIPKYLRKQLKKIYKIDFIYHPNSGLIPDDFSDDKIFNNFFICPGVIFDGVFDVDSIVIMMLFYKTAEQENSSVFTIKKKKIVKELKISSLKMNKAIKRIVKENIAIITKQKNYIIVNLIKIPDIFLENR